MRRALCALSDEMCLEEEKNQRPVALCLEDPLNVNAHFTLYQEDQNRAAYR